LRTSSISWVENRAWQSVWFHDEPESGGEDG
jgi:hypothetical protein